MTLLYDANGRVIDQEWGWLRRAMCLWVSDERVCDSLIRSGRATPLGLKITKSVLFDKRVDVIDSKMLRETALGFLSASSSRKMIVRAVLKEQERQLDAWAAEIDQWLMTPEGVDTGPKPERPPKLTRRQLIEEFRRLQKELADETPTPQPAAG
jgi:hypothetical protein